MCGICYWPWILPVWIRFLQFNFLRSWIQNTLNTLWPTTLWRNFSISKRTDRPKQNCRQFVLFTMLAPYVISWSSRSANFKFACKNKKNVCAWEASDSSQFSTAVASYAQRPSTKCVPVHDGPHSILYLNKEKYSTTHLLKRWSTLTRNQTTDEAWILLV